MHRVVGSRDGEEAGCVRPVLVCLRRRRAVSLLRFRTFESVQDILLPVLYSEWPPLRSASRAEEALRAVFANHSKEESGAWIRGTCQPNRQCVLVKSQLVSWHSRKRSLGHAASVSESKLLVTSPKCAEECAGTGFASLHLKSRQDAFLLPRCRS